MPITASENPIGVYGASASGFTIITWSTNSTTIRGRVFKTVTENGVTGPETLFDGDVATGSLTGSQILTLQNGASCTLTLRRATNNAVLATLVVTTWNLEELLLVGATRDAVIAEKAFPPQGIYDLKVKAGIDTCHVTFKTTQPTTPFLQATDSEGTNVASAFPLLGGLRTQHEMLLGEVTALPQDSRLALKIVAAGHDINGQKTEAVVETSFKTGMRFAFVALKEIDVRKDGDPNSAGDFTWRFGAGNPENDALLAPQISFDLDISDDDPPVAIDEMISIGLAPRNLCIGATGGDDDLTVPYPGQGLGVWGYPSLTGDRTGHGEISNYVEYAWVTRVFDIADLGNETVVPMELSTGNFGVAFTIRGQITIRLKPGISPRFPGFEFWESPKLATDLPKGGFTTGKRKPRLARSADGAVLRQAADAPGADQGWTLAAPAVEGAVTLASLPDDRAALFALDAEGGVIRAALDGGDGIAAWEPLGGQFAGSVAAVARPDAIELVTRDTDGTVFHCTLGNDGMPVTDWLRVGGGAETQPIALALDADIFAVFALGTRGEVLMRRHRAGRWLSEDWQVVEGVTGLRLGVSAIEGRGLTLAVLAADMTLWTQSVQDARDLTARGWVAHGDLQPWLTREYAPIEERQTARAMLAA